ncbi:MAG: hypothetical protein ACK4N5_12690 [Myxococcales bacterium]
MRRLVVVLLACAGCGAPGDASAPLGVDIRGVAPESLGFVQVVVLARAANYTCDAVNANCLATVPDADIVRQRVGSAEEKATRVAINSAQATGQGQTLSVQVPSGTNYLFVAQALSTDGRRILAAGCEPVANIVEGENTPVLIRVRDLNPVPACDPTLK